jgi:AcrR family transcriptional regulator
LYPLETRERLLDSAELLFANKGIDNTSIRDIVQSAETNLASVHYHFGNKTKLVFAVLERRITPINQERLQRLQETVQESRLDPDARLEAILRAFIEPAVLVMSAEPKTKLFLLIMGQVHQSPKVELKDMLNALFQDVFNRFLSALCACRPKIPPGRVFMHFGFVVGAMIHSAMMMSRPLIFRPFASLTSPPDGKKIAEELLEFALKGFAHEVED